MIFDVDGTVAIRDKSPDGRGPYDWDRVGEDQPNRNVLLIAKLLASAKLHIIFVSGRDEAARFHTEEWLEDHYGYGFSLLMRQHKDNRADDIVKAEILDWLQQSYEIVAVFDDRNQVVDMWRAKGLTCFQVCSREDGDF